MSTKHIKALKLALEGAANYIDALGGDSRKYRQALAEQPAQRKPLTYEQIKTRTDEQIEATFKICGGRWNGDHWVIEDADLHPFVRTIEGADLNTLRAISDEYNAWIKHHAAGHSYDDFLAKRESAPPQREWQGLTDEEILQTLDLVAYDTQAFDFAYRIETKLKEKNT